MLSSKKSNLLGFSSPCAVDQCKRYFISKTEARASCKSGVKGKCTNPLIPHLQYSLQDSLQAFFPASRIKDVGRELQWPREWHAKKLVLFVKQLHDFCPHAFTWGFQKHVTHEAMMLSQCNSGCWSISIVP